MTKSILNHAENAIGCLTEEKVYCDRMQGRLIKPPAPFRLIDLFSGAGGLTLGFTNVFGHAFVPVWANDFNPWAVDTYNKNFGNHCVEGDILEILRDKKFKIPEVDVVIGGPPCQGFSLLNKKRSNDPRRELWKPFLDIVRLTHASVFVMENVPQLLNTPEHNTILEIATQMGYQTASAKLCSADYGVAQTRFRAFIIGCNFANPGLVFPPKKSHYDPLQARNYELYNSENGYIENPKPWNSVRSAIGDLPDAVGTEIRENEKSPLNLHFGRNPTEMSVKRYKAIPKEGMNRFDLQKRAPDLTPACWIRKKTGGTDLFGRLWWDKPAFTIRTEFYKPEKGRYLHPSKHRPITHREAARLQSFPDGFTFMGSKIEIAKQIGNAVPPLLATRIADSVFTLLSLKDQ